MAQLQIPLSIWLSATPDERDQFYLQAGFDPNLAVIDNGTDTNFVRFRQDSNLIAETPLLVSTGGPQAGDDLRDFAQSISTSIVTDEFGLPAPIGDPLTPAVIGATALAARLPNLVRPTFLTWAASMIAGARIAFASLPSWLRAALTAIGLTGVTIAIDESLEAGGLPSLPGSFIGGDGPQVDIQIGSNPLQAVQVVGTWMANGVKFYRLADGKLAVQNKKGRWKVWRPKRPIVLYADGASSLKTMLRADKALNKQAKKIAAMLNRRAPRRKSGSTSPNPPIILGNNARVVDV